ncbi:MAG: patatin-like phospholipase family protein [Patescibacteria group bacterium]
MEKLGLALGSGGARGYAHIGAIKALTEEGWNPDIITGSSIGSLIGVLYGYYESVEKVEEVMLDSYWREALEMTGISRGGVMSAEKVQKFFEGLVGDARLEDLSIPVGVVATDFHTAEAVLIKKGKASQAMQASSAFPLFIEPLRTKNRVLWDGGLSSQVPTGAARQMGATRIIGVNLNGKIGKTKEYEEMNPYAIGRKAIESLQHHMTRMSMQEADIKITPKLDSTILLGFGTLVKKDEGKRLINQGYEEAKRIIKEIKNEQTT